MELPFALETPLERQIAADPEWQEGVAWGEPRAGHQEGAVMYHIADVLANIDRACPPADERSALRLIALVHDTFKYRVDESKPKIGKNHHAHIARVFAERYIADPALLDIIELHDMAYHCWRVGHYRQHWQRAEEGIDHLIERLGPAFALYVRFFFADSDTESKDPAPMHWFEKVLREREVSVPLC